jgi:hypothetical protein
VFWYLLDLVIRTLTVPVVDLVLIVGLSVLDSRRYKTHKSVKNISSLMLKRNAGFHRFKCLYIID